MPRPILYSQTVVDQVCDLYGLNRKQLAEKLGISKGAVSHWAKRNKIPIRFAKILADKSEGHLNAFKLAGMA